MLNNNNKKEIKTFEQYKEEFNSIYLEFKTKKGLTVLDIILFFGFYFIISIVILLIFTKKIDNNYITIALLTSLILMFVHIRILFIIDNNKLNKEILNYNYHEDIKEEKTIKSRLKFVKYFNKRLELYCKKRLVDKYKINEDNFKNILNETIKRLDNLKNKRFYSDFEAVLKILVKTGLITLVLKFCFTQIISNPNKIFSKFSGIIKWVKIDNSMFSMFIAILIFIVTLGILVVASILNTNKKNIDIEIGRKKILLDILIEIFTKSTINETINETIWITEEAEKKVMENKGYFFTKSKEEPVSITENNGKFYIIEDKSNPKNIKLKKIKIENIKFKQ